MESSVWRPRAKIIAILEIVFLILAILVVVLVVYFTVVEANVDPVMGIVTCFFFATMIVTEMYAAVKLLQAAQLGKDRKVGARNARIWRNITTVCSTIFLSICLVTLSILPAVCTIIWRGISLYVVISFITELEDVTASRSSGDLSEPLDVIV